MEQRRAYHATGHYDISASTDATRRIIRTILVAIGIWMFLARHAGSKRKTHLEHTMPSRDERH